MVNSHSITDKAASKISNLSYRKIQKRISIQSTTKKQVWEKVETIKSPDTGLDGYVLQNPDTNEIVIISRGQNQILLKIMKKIFLELFLVIPIIPKENMEKHLI
ncbi:hypothetical protein [Virgibacillus pantothenticus]|uniref:Uncharacterized protein n=2 Tax=Bacillaceae TaxID=186817 RepID=A0A0L0QJG9_VIRPA|nr:hypothetical protein [Virgibacillus pantothenticus]API93070.1 hypothetical protein BKP57_15405 [Virgibacillus sp. 6R]MBS7429364.1 hypothetical protein [Virgibacillus sp. 19R1-5]KNE18712.1 hypothetical protein AFK71_08810 [Virgibacillus pantothenticus]MED3737802.1 hypothetical protein [Virgibacillus pantothenticus]QTY15123.1 hypothetical protein KBP50_14540 [Virgibacillus pantothenticus]